MTQIATVIHSQVFYGSFFFVVEILFKINKGEIGEAASKPKDPQFKLNGNSLTRKSLDDKFNSPSRPAPTAFSIHDPVTLLYFF